MQEQTYTLVVDFSIQGNAVYLSHQEMLTMFQRALIRASVPFVYSKGFNPHPYLSIPFPRSVGTRSEGDRICATIEFSDESEGRDWLPEIQSELPAGLMIQAVQCVSGKCMYHPCRVRYIFCIQSPLEKCVQDHFYACRKDIQEQKPIEIQRYWAKKRRYKTIDLLTYLELLEFSDDRIEVTCGVSQSGTARVDEIMKWLQLSVQQLAEPVCRTDIRWQDN